jgi:hypothetical protein
MRDVWRKSGAEGQNRTADTVIFSHVLYQLSYLGTVGTQRAVEPRDHTTGPQVGHEQVRDLKAFSFADDKNPM